MASKFTLPFADVGAGITPSSGATLDFYETGTYSRRDTYTDAGAGTANANPVVADSTGVFPAIFIDGAYRVVLSDSNGVQIWEEDGVENPVSDDIATNAAAIAVLQSEIDNQLNNVIDGLVPSNGADTDHDITISDGSAADSTKASRLVLSESLTKQIDASWAAGNNAGGLFSGTVAADTTYHLFIIEKDSDGSIDAGFDTSLTAANIPSGYTKYRRTSSFLTDASANIIAFIANECSGGALCFNYVERITDVSTSSPGAGTTIYASSTPSPVGSAIKINMAVYLDSTGFSTQAICIGSPLLDLVQFGKEADIWHQSSGLVSSVNLEVMTSESGSIAFYSSDPSVSSFEINTIGFTDYRI